MGSIGGEQLFLLIPSIPPIHSAATASLLRTVGTFKSAVDLFASPKYWKVQKFSLHKNVHHSTRQEKEEEGPLPSDWNGWSLLWGIIVTSAELSANFDKQYSPTRVDEPHWEAMGRRTNVRKGNMNCLEGASGSDMVHEHHVRGGKGCYGD